MPHSPVSGVRASLNHSHRKVLLNNLEKFSCIGYSPRIDPNCCDVGELCYTLHSKNYVSHADTKIIKFQSSISQNFVGVFQQIGSTRHVCFKYIWQEISCFIDSILS